MENDFKINIFFDENGETVEELISEYLIKIVNKKKYERALSL